ncbi:serine/threonine protein kinase [Thalassobacillus hwangdonensis]|uniref:Serine/threonine protein kinase n=2 Tax=Thalassobacillus hwangdonensis TaxID=546108 RepID=A0ABW3KZE1_9BACI
MEEIGTLVDERYHIIDFIDRGSTSHVYLCVDQVTSMKLVLKLTEKEHPLSAQLSNEAKQLMSIDHPRIPTLYDFGEWKDRLYAVQEFRSGTSLEPWVRDGMDFSMMRKVWVGLAEVLCYLHDTEVRLVHRDIKPSNILIDHNGGITLLDFGISAPIGNTDVPPLGSKAFVAPEQYRRNLPVHPSADMYSAGALIFHMIVKDFPQRSNDINAERLYNAGVSVKGISLLKRMLALDPGQRPCAIEVYQELIDLP